MGKHKRIRTQQQTNAVRNDDLEPSAWIDDDCDTDVLRAEGEGMVTTDQPSVAQLPPVPMMELFRARLDAAGRSLTHVQLPAMRRALAGQISAHPIATLAFVAAAGAIGGMLLRSRPETQE